jgi:hypothetical protein
MRSDLRDDDLVAGIARDLEIDGTSVRWVRPIPQQRQVEVRWAAKRAGRLIGQHVRTSVAPVSDLPGSDVAVVVTLDPDSPSV